MVDAVWSTTCCEQQSGGRAIGAAYLRGSGTEKPRCAAEQDAAAACTAEGDWGERAGTSANQLCSLAR